MGSYYGFQSPGQDRLLQKNAQMMEFKQDFDLRLKQLDAIGSQIQDQESLQKHRIKIENETDHYKNKLFDLQVELHRLQQKANNEGLMSIIPQFKGKPIYQQLMQQLKKPDPTSVNKYKNALQRKHGYPGIGNTVITGLVAPFKVGKTIYDGVNSISDSVNKANVNIKKISDSQILPAVAIGSALAGTGYLLYKGSKKVAQKLPQPIKQVGKFAGNFLVDQYGGKMTKYIKDNYGQRVKNEMGYKKDDAIQFLKDFFTLSTAQTRGRNQKKLQQAHVKTKNGNVIKFTDILQGLSQRTVQNISSKVKQAVYNGLDGPVNIDLILSRLGHNQKKQIFERIKHVQQQINQQRTNQQGEDQNRRLNKIVIHR